MRQCVVLSAQICYSKETFASRGPTEPDHCVVAPVAVTMGLVALHASFSKSAPISTR